MCCCTILEILVKGVDDSIMPPILWVEVEVDVLNSYVLSSNHWERKQWSWVFNFNFTIGHNVIISEFLKGNVKP